MNRIATPPTYQAFSFLNRVFYFVKFDAASSLKPQKTNYRNTQISVRVYSKLAKNDHFLAKVNRIQLSSSTEA